MNKRDIIIGLVILALVSFFVFWSKGGKTPNITSNPTTHPSIQEKIEKSFKVQLPQNQEKAELKNVVGKEGVGVVTRDFNGKKFSLTILADLPDPEEGSFYEGWIVRGKEKDSSFSVLSIGKLRLAKGGWILDFESSKDYSDYKGVVVTLEKVDDKVPEKHILEGSF